jgi:hypothetical protein
MLHWQEKQRLPPVQMDPALHNVTTEFAVVMSYINVVPLLGPHFSLYIPPMLLFWLRLGIFIINAWWAACSC